MKIRFKFQPRDLWLGVFVPKPQHFMRAEVDKTRSRRVPCVATTYQVYLCLVPMLPIVFEWERVKPIPQNMLRARLLEIGSANERAPLSKMDLVHNVIDAIRKNEGEL